MIENHIHIIIDKWIYNNAYIIKQYL